MGDPRQAQAFAKTRGALSVRRSGHVLSMTVAIVDVVNVIFVLHCLVAAVFAVLMLFDSVLCNLVFSQGEVLPGF